jgi:hypothetical protein
MFSNLASRFNGLSLPVKILGGAAVVLFGYLLITGTVSTMWARHIANKALRGIASSISDIDKVEGKNAALEQAVGELARQTQELQAKADEERRLREKLEVEKQHAEDKAELASRLAEKLRQADLNRVPVTTLEGARDAVNRALASRRHQ